MDETLVYETIGDRGRTLKSNLPDLIGQQATDVFLAEQAELRSAGRPESAAPVGTVLPDAPLVTASGASTTLVAESAGRPAVLVFYRGAWCPFCNLALATYETDLLPALQARDVRLLAISPQRPERAERLADDRGLSFPLLGDPGNGLARALGLTMQPSAPAVERLRLLGSDMADFSIDGTREVPYPTVVVADAAGTIRFLDVHSDYSTRTEVADVLAAVDEVLLNA